MNTYQKNGDFSFLKWKKNYWIIKHCIIIKLLIRTCLFFFRWGFFHPVFVRRNKMHFRQLLSPSPVNLKIGRESHEVKWEFVFPFSAFDIYRRAQLYPINWRCLKKYSLCISNFKSVSNLFNLCWFSSPFDFRRHISCELCDIRVHGGYDFNMNQVNVFNVLLEFLSLEFSRLT